MHGELAAERGQLGLRRRSIPAPPARRSCRAPAERVVHVGRDDARAKPPGRPRGAGSCSRRSWRSMRSALRRPLRPLPENFALATASRSPFTVERDIRDLAAKSWNVSLRATKSVSALTSTTAPCPPSADDGDEPLGRDPARLLGRGGEALLAQPVDRLVHDRRPVSDSAFLQSIMPAPVFSRSSLTSAAVISPLIEPLSRLTRSTPKPSARRGRSGRSPSPRPWLPPQAPPLRAAAIVGRHLRAFHFSEDSPLEPMHLLLQPVEHRVGDQIAVELDRAHARRRCPGSDR